MNRNWAPQALIPKDQILRESATLLNAPPTPIVEAEDLFRIQAVGLEWDIGVMTYSPTTNPALAPDGSKIGVFLLHGGSGDFREMEGFARLLASRLRYNVVSMTYPGRLYLDAPDRSWPGDTVNEDGTVRVPIWLKGEHVSPDQYDLVKDDSLKARYGTRLLAKARPGTIFHARLSGWPLAFEKGMIEACHRQFGDGHSILVHGHSTGGPFVAALSQRVETVTGVLAIENSPFGYIQERSRTFTGNLERVSQGLPEKSISESVRTDPFDELGIRTWRDLARYIGPEAAAAEGASALMRLPELMEQVHDEWDELKNQANFKCEYLVTRNITPSLRAAAAATSARLGLDQVETEALTERYTSLTRELSGPEVKPVPPTLFGITKASRDHPPEVYSEVVLPAYAAMQPPPRTALTVFDGGVHDYARPENGLPMGVAPSVATQWQIAIDNGFFQS